MIRIALGPADVIAFDRDGGVHTTYVARGSRHELDGAPATATERRLAAWIRRWLRDPSTPVDVALIPSGPPFHRACWEALARMAPGTTWSYAELAKRAGRPAAVRAAAQSMARNRSAPLIPCHRVVGARDGGGFMGAPHTATGSWELALKQWLLQREARKASRKVSRKVPRTPRRAA